MYVGFQRKIEQNKNQLVEWRVIGYRVGRGGRERGEGRMFPSILCKEDAKKICKQLSLLSPVIKEDLLKIVEDC